MKRMDNLVMFTGRVLIAVLFVLAGAAKITGPAPFLEHMTRFGVPRLFLPAVIALELGCGLALLLGWRIRYAAGALAIFCVLTAVIFHHELSIKPELTLFLKDLAIAGGLFFISASTAQRDRTTSPVPG